MIERIYRLSLWICPEEFRERFGAEILDTARQVDGSAANNWRPVIAAIQDAGFTAIALRFEPVLDPPVRREHKMQSILQDLRFAARGLRRDPLFALFAIITLGLGLGANAAMFGIVDRLLLRGPDHVREPARVVRLYQTTQPVGMRSFTGSVVGNVTYDVMRTGVDAFSAVANYANNEATLGRGTNARPARAGYTSGTFFDLLGVRPELGIFYGTAEDSPDGAAHVVVLSHTTWMQEFGGDRAIVGKDIVVSDEPYRVIGVSPPGFTGADIAPVDVWLPMNLVGPHVTTDWKTTWNAQWLNVIGRLRDGETAAHANAEATKAIRAAYVGDDESMKRADVFVAPLNADESGSEGTESRVARWLLGVSVVMLLIVCANLVNLLLARSVKRAREIAIRQAVGASLGRLRRLLVVESLVLALGGSCVGYVVAWVLGNVARQRLLGDVVWSSSPVDARMLAISSLAAVIIGVGIGLISAMRAGSVSLTKTLKTGGGGDGGGRRARLRNTLSIAQAAMSVALLIGAGLFIRSLSNARSLRLGIEPDQAVLAELRRGRITITDTVERRIERDRRREFAGIAIERLKGVPGVEHAAVAVGMPFGNRFSVWTRPVGRDSMPRLSTGGPSVSAVSSDYFATVGTRIINGRGFTANDHAGTERVTVVSATMAKVVWPGVNPIGQCLRAFNDQLPCARVIGVAEDTRRSGLREEPTMHYYVPLGQEVGIGGSVLLVRGQEPRRLEPAVRKALIDMDGSISYVQMQTMQERIDPQMRPWKLGTAVLSAAGLLALIVAVVGIYSVTSYLVSLRTKEIGVRVALGATAMNVARLVTSNALGTSLAGLAIGSAIALGAGKFLEPLLFDESPRDPVVFGLVAGVLIIASLLACVVPGLRANRIDPIDALRAE